MGPIAIPPPPGKCVGATALRPRAAVELTPMRRGGGRVSHEGISQV